MNTYAGSAGGASGKKTALVIGSGAGGAVMADRLQGKYQVTVLEAGGKFRPFHFSVRKLAELRKSGLFFDERMIRLLLPNMLVEKTDDMVMVRGIGLGGTTTLATGNAVRCGAALKEIGIDLDEQYDKLEQELPICTDHRKYWNRSTKSFYRVFREMGLEPAATPKFMHTEECIRCGHCAIGCPAGAKWDSRALIDRAVSRGAELVSGCRVRDLEISGNAVTAVNARRHGKKEVYQADLVILAAGGLGSPVILEKSGIACSRTLFVDPVLCLAGPLEGFRQDRQLLMPFISQQDGYILSPYMDYLSFFFNKDWRLPMQDIASVMIKLSDEAQGAVDGKRIDKSLTALDKNRLKRAEDQCREILERLGVPAGKQFKGTLNAGHPGGMMPLTEAEKDTLHNPQLPENMYLADASILPKSLGNPPILTIMALAEKIADLL